MFVFFKKLLKRAFSFLQKTGPKTKYTYVINGKTYIQKPLVWGQIRQLQNILSGIDIPKDINAISLISLFGESLQEAIAIVITEKGVELGKKDIDAMAKEFEFNLDMHTATQVVEDFLACNPIASLFERLSGVITQVWGKAQQTTSDKSVSS